MNPQASTAVTGQAGQPEGRDLRGAVGLIPAWRPDARLAALVQALRELGLADIVIVDDGSGPAFAPLFEELASLAGVTVCHHGCNRGKGRALKTGFAFVLSSLPHARAVVTADADGQHLPQDIARVAWQTLQQPNGAVLGMRSFAAGVPLRSRVGNQLTRYLFALSGGRLLHDTQTGLRGLPLTLLRGLAELPGERYEFEMVMLAHLCGLKLPLLELPIQTIYLDGNRGSHFHPLRDSFLVYRALLRFRGGRIVGGSRRRRSAAATDEPRLHTA